MLSARARGKGAVLLTVAAIGGTLVGWSLRGGARAGNASILGAARPIIEGAEAPESVVEPELRSIVRTDGLTADDDGAVRPTIWDGLEILDQAIGSPPGAPLGSEAFEQRYQGATDAQILIAHAAAESKLERERSKIAEELLASGRYVETIQRSGDPSPFPRGGPGRRVTSFGFQIEHGDGFDVVRTAEIDPEEFPEFHAIEMEYLWLAEKANKLKKGL